MIKALLSQSISVLAVRIVGTGIAVLASILIARILGSAALGIFGYLSAMIAILASPVSNGWSLLVLRETSKQHSFGGDGEGIAHLGTQFSWLSTATLALLMSAALLVFRLVPPEATGRFDGILAAVLVCIVFQMDQYSSLRMARMRGINRPVLGQLPETILRPIALSSSIGAAYLFFPRGEILIVLLASLAIAATIAASVGQLTLRHFGWTPARAHFDRAQRSLWVRRAMALTLAGGLIQLNGYMDILLLGLFVSAEELGHYRAAVQLAMLTNFGFMALNFLAGQRFARLSDEQQIAQLQGTASLLARLAFFSAAPVTVVLATMGTWIFSVTFGAGFTSSAVPATIISIGISVNAAIGMPYTLTIMKSGVGRRGLLLTGIALLVNIVAGVVLIPNLGLAGAAVANCLGLTVWGGLFWLAVFRRYGIDTSILGLTRGKYQLADSGRSDG